MFYVTVFFEFTVRCPACGNTENRADGCSTDDWAEVFVFSGYSEKSAGKSYDPDYTCPACGKKTDRTALYRNRCITFSSEDKLIEYLERVLGSVIRDGDLWDHGWNPDLDAALHRYSLLFPQNRRLAEMKGLFYRAVHDRKYFTKFEPSSFTRTVTADMIPYRAYLEKIYLPDSVTVIGDHAFSNSRIGDAFLPRHVTTVGKSAFEGCCSLYTVHSSDALVEIGDSAFAGTPLRRFFFPNGIKKIGAYAFRGTRLSEVFLPAGCEFVGEGAFAGCTQLKKVTVPAALTDIANWFDPTVTLCYPDGTQSTRCPDGEQNGISQKIQIEVI